MKDTIAKYLPFVVGGLIGWLMFNPPQWLALHGPLRTAIMIALAIVLLVAFIVYSISNSIPGDVVLAPHAGPVDASISAHAERIQSLGFVAAGPPCRVEIKPAVTLLPFVHGSEPVLIQRHADKALTRSLIYAAKPGNGGIAPPKSLSDHYKINCITRSALPFRS